MLRRSSLPERPRGYEGSRHSSGTQVMGHLGPPPGMMMPPWCTQWRVCWAVGWWVPPVHQMGGGQSEIKLDVGVGSGAVDVGSGRF